MRNIAEMKVAGKWSFRLSCSALKVALPPSIRPMTVLCAFLATLPCISITISFWNSASSSRLYNPSAMGLGCPPPWGSFFLVRCLGAQSESDWEEEPLWGCSASFLMCFYHSSHLDPSLWRLKYLLLPLALRQRCPGLPDPTFA